MGILHANTRVQPAGVLRALPGPRIASSPAERPPGLSDTVGTLRSALHSGQALHQITTSQVAKKTY